MEKVVSCFILNCDISNNDIIRVVLRRRINFFIFWIREKKEARDYEDKKKI